MLYIVRLWAGVVNSIIINVPNILHNSLQRKLIALGDPTNKNPNEWCRANVQAMGPVMQLLRTYVSIYILWSEEFAPQVVKVFLNTVYNYNIN